MATKPFTKPEKMNKTELKEWINWTKNEVKEFHFLF